MDVAGRRALVGDLREHGERGLQRVRQVARSVPHARKPLRLVVHEAVDGIEHRPHFVGRDVRDRHALAALEAPAGIDRALQRGEAAHDDASLQPGEHEDRREHRAEQSVAEAGDRRVEIGDVLGDGDDPVGLGAREAARVGEQRLVVRPRLAMHPFAGVAQRDRRQVLVPQRARADRPSGVRGRRRARDPVDAEIVTRERQAVHRSHRVGRGLLGVEGRLCRARRRAACLVRAGKLHVEGVGVVLEARRDVALDELAREMLQPGGEQRGGHDQHERQGERQPVAQRAHASARKTYPCPRRVSIRSAPSKARSLRT